jgi:photosystem II stability/assembly factor-like uncharacterized protein
MNPYKAFLPALALLSATAIRASGAAAPEHAATAPAVVVLAARPSPSLAATEYLAATRAGQRIVAVGEHGTIALSDDSGKTWRQALSVPTSAALTDVHFVDASNGWAVGHWGTILRTVDGGVRWTLQRSDTKVDQPLFSVHFLNPKEGFAVGLWSLILATHDGGASWSPLALPKPEGAGRGDRNLYKLFATPDATLFITAERGLVYRSEDRGASWEALASGYAGSLWTGVALDNGAILAAGLRGSLYRSADKGHSWSRIDTHTTSSITSLVQLASHEVVGTALDGVVIRSQDGGQSFRVRQDGARSAYTAVVGLDSGRTLVFSAHGPLAPQ